MTNEEQQQGWRLAAIGLLGLVLLIGGLGSLIAFTPLPLYNWRPDVTYREKAGDPSAKPSDNVSDRRPGVEAGGPAKTPLEPVGEIRRAKAAIE